uniref:Uncharacterized protein n=1 Tax=Anguilla anguilla TaxID=7936 RepID=A0A0E9WL79_ANGAN
MRANPDIKCLPSIYVFELSINLTGECVLLPYKTWLVCVSN